MLGSLKVKLFLSLPAFLIQVVGAGLPRHLKLQLDMEVSGFPPRDSPDEYSGLPGSFPHHRFQQHIPGFTGHIHKLRDTFGTTYAYSTRVAQQCPPSYPGSKPSYTLKIEVK